MSKPQEPCSKCKGEMTVKPLETFSGVEGGVKVTIEAMPAAVCGQGHKRFVYPMFAGMLMDMVMDEDTYRFTPSAVKKGLFTKRYHCPGCDQELPGMPTGQKSCEMTAEFKHADPFKLQVDVPVYKCGGCGKEFIHSSKDTGKLALAATGHAYRATDIHPE
ncbi:MAG: hypothetical protein HY888_07095 [Deltaproteobacteria bacterium]|nr:hypothetical protein [Deltaproteobacteria bacterium]